MESLATITIIMYALAFVITFGALAAWWYSRSRRRGPPGEAPPRHVDDQNDRIAS